MEAKERKARAELVAQAHQPGQDPRGPVICSRNTIVDERRQANIMLNVALLATIIVFFLIIGHGCLT
jgi:hypothetical protein